MPHLPVEFLQRSSLIFDPRRKTVKINRIVPVVR